MLQTNIYCVLVDEGDKQVILDIQDCSLCQMVFAIGRLIWFKEMIRIKI